MGRNSFEKGLNQPLIRMQETKRKSKGKKEKRGNEKGNRRQRDGGGRRKRNKREKF